MKITNLFFFLLLCLTGLTTGCIGNNGIATGDPTHDATPEETQPPVSHGDDYIIDITSVHNLGSGSIITNTSFIAGISLRDNNVKEMLRHNSTLMGIIDFMPSRPKGWNMSVGPTLWVVHKDIDVYFYVNETGEYVERFEIVVPGSLYSKERAGDITCLLDHNGSRVLAFNTSRIWIPKKGTCS